ncbi:MAG: YfhO family protein, partial [Lachnospiraceae bacterium]|nr:YfhO family protein [Lachnospiraceae bacterium]
MRTDTDSKEDSIPKYFVYQGDSDGFSIYENEYFIPMGFTFDSFIRESEVKEILYPDDNKSDLQQYNLLKADSLLVKDIILSDEQAERYSDILAHDSQERWLTLTDTEFKSQCERRAQSACTSFSYDPDGYTATISLSRKNLVFFSIPYDKGFKAYVDGEETVIEKVDFGFMAVPVSSGEHEIRLEYRPDCFGY